MSSDTFAIWLRRQLTRREWSAADLARKMEIRPGVVSHWLIGERIPSTKSIDKISDVLGADLDMLLTMTGHRPATEAVDPNDPQELTAQRIRRLKWNRGRQVTIDGILNAWEAQDRGELK